MFTLYPQGFITGTVTYQGAPLANNYVDADTPGNPFGYSTYTDSNGVYSIGWLVPGVYRIRVQMPEPSNVDWFYFEGVSVGAGETVNGVNIDIP